jgi:hypothetical protein
LNSIDSRSHMNGADECCQQWAQKDNAINCHFVEVLSVFLNIQNVSKTINLEKNFVLLCFVLLMEKMRNNMFV